MGGGWVSELFIVCVCFGAKDLQCAGVHKISHRWRVTHHYLSALRFFFQSFDTFLVKEWSDLLHEVYSMN